MSMILYGFKEPKDQISTLNKLFADSLESYAPTHRVKLTHHIVSWMKDPTIVSDRQKLELPQIKSRNSKTQKNIKNIWKIKSNTRKLVKIKRTNFLVKRGHQKILKWYGILLILYSINNKKE